MALSVNVNGAWKRVNNTYVNVNGTWKNVPQIYINISGTWRPIYTYSWSIGGWGGCSASCGGGTQTRSVTCTRNDGATVADSICTKFVGAKPATSQSCNTQSCYRCLYYWPVNSWSVDSTYRFANVTYSKTNDLNGVCSAQVDANATSAILYNCSEGTVHVTRGAYKGVGASSAHEYEICISS